jgi:hypothetical protein
VNDASDAEDRAIARALDADSDERTRAADPRVVDEYREVLGQLPIAEVSPAPDLEDRIVGAALERRAATGTTTPMETPMERKRSRVLRRIRVASLATAVAAAIVVGVILATGTSPAPVPSARVSLATVRRAQIDSLARAPGSRVGTLGAIGRVVLASNGDGAVYDLKVDTAVAVGLVSSGGTTVIGPALPRGGVIAFVVDHPERVRTVTLMRQGSVLASAALSAP